MRLDVVKDELSFLVERKVALKFGKADGFKSEGLRLVVMLKHEGDSATLTDFKIKHI